VAVFENGNLTARSQLKTKEYPEQAMLLDKTYKQFARGGSNLPEDKQAQLRAINKELSMLSLQFGDNVLAETNAFKLVIDNPADLEGLPQSVGGSGRLRQHALP